MCLSPETYTTPNQKVSTLLNPEQCILNFILYPVKVVLNHIHNFIVTFKRFLLVYYCILIIIYNFIIVYSFIFLLFILFICFCSILVFEGKDISLKNRGFIILPSFLNGVIKKVGMVLK